MRIINLLLLTITTCSAWLSVNAQDSGNWYIYHEAKKDLYGYKDVKGKVKIPARFEGFTHATTFRNIIAVKDANKSYYLLRNGRKVAKDSLYVWDMTYDCEQEGTIRFRDPVTDKVGFLNKKGKVAIRANFNDARPFYNGLALVVHHGKRICADGKPYKGDCEHWSWDGKTALINTKGKIVADNIDIMSTYNLNWYSAKQTNSPADTALYNSFKTNNNKFYTFINYEKEFNKWFYRQFLTGLQAGSISSTCFTEVMVEEPWSKTLSKVYSKTDFLKRYNALMQRRMGTIKQRKVETFIVSETLNSYIYTSNNFKAYYTDCGEANRAKFPLFDVITSHYNAKKQFSHQEHFSFLKTENGYKLIGVALKSAK